MVGSWRTAGVGRGPGHPRLELPLRGGFNAWILVDRSSTMFMFGIDSINESRLDFVCVRCDCC